MILRQTLITGASAGKNPEKIQPSLKFQTTLNASIVITDIISLEKANEQ